MSYNYKLILAETDSCFFYKESEEKFSETECSEILKAVNSILPDLIKVESDGVLDTCVLIKRKNYIKKQSDGKVVYKGSSLKSANKEPAFKTFMHQVIQILLDHGIDYDKLLSLYNQTILSVHHITDIHPFCTKKSISKKILNAERTTEAKIFEAVKDLTPREGDKFYLFFLRGEDPYAKDCELCYEKNWKPGMENPVKLMQRVYDTMKIFANIIDIKRFPKYHLKSNKKLLEGILNE